MKIEEQVCTLEQANRLRELGVESKSIFYWVDRGNQSRLVFEKNIEFIDKLPIISAYTVAELGEMLPDIYMTMRDGFGEFICEDFNEYAEPSYRYTGHKTEAQARAARLIQLIEKGILQPAKTPEA